MAEEKAQEKETGIAQIEFSSAEKKMMRDVYASEASEFEFDFFMAVAKRRKLNPLAGQIFLIPFKGKRIPVVSIHGLLTIAKRSGDYAGATPVQFLGEEDDKWFDVWDKDEPPRAARIGVYIKGVPHPTMAVATWKQSAKYDKGKLRDIWEAYGPDMLEKCALAKAVRRAFPDDAGGLYIAEEFGHPGIQDIDHAPEAATPRNTHQQTATATAKAGYSDEDIIDFGTHKRTKWCDVKYDWLEYVVSPACKTGDERKNRAQWELDSRAGKLEPENGNIQDGDVPGDAPIDGTDMDPAEYRALILTDIRNLKDSMDKDAFGVPYKAFAEKHKVRNFGDENIPIEALVEFADNLKAAFDKELEGGK